MSGNYQQYNEYNKILRSWFVAFGAGGPAVFLVNKEVRDRLIETGQFGSVVELFLWGVAAQVVIAFLNKLINWYGDSDGDTEYEKTRRYRYSKTLLNWFWLDIAADLFTMWVFAKAVLGVFAAFAT